MTAVEEQPSSLFCAAEHPITGDLCHRLAALCDGQHTFDGLPPWVADNPREETEQ